MKKKSKEPVTHLLKHVWFMKGTRMFNQNINTDMRSVPLPSLLVVSEEQEIDIWLKNMALYLGNYISLRIKYYEFINMPPIIIW